MIYQHSIILQVKRKCSIVAHSSFLQRVRHEPLCESLRAELRHVLRGGQGLAGQDERVEFRRRWDGLEHLVDVFVG